MERIDVPLRRKRRQIHLVERSPVKRALASIVGCSQLSHGLEDLVHEGGQFRKNISVTSEVQAKKAIQKFAEAAQHGIMTQSVRRLALLHISYEIDRLQNTGDRRMTANCAVGNEIAAAERQFAEISESTAARVRSLRRSSHLCEIAAGLEDGLGWILLLRDDSNRLYMANDANPQRLEPISRVEATHKTYFRARDAPRKIMCGGVRLRATDSLVKDARGGEPFRSSTPASYGGRLCKTLVQRRIC
nr:hypothetical protein CFP56_59661 [Quercus suber]